MNYGHTDAWLDRRVRDHLTYIYSYTRIKLHGILHKSQYVKWTVVCTGNVGQANVFRHFHSLFVGENFYPDRSIWYVYICKWFVQFGLIWKSPLVQIDWYILTKLDVPHSTLRQSINRLIFQDRYQLYLFICKQPKFFKHLRLFNIIALAIDLKCFLPMICRHNLIKCMTWIVSSWRRGIYRWIICRIFFHTVGTLSAAGMVLTNWQHK